MNVKKERKEKLMSAKEAAGLVEDEMWVDYGFGMGQPFLIDDELGERVEDLNNVNVIANLSLKEWKILENDPEGKTFSLNDAHFSLITRKYGDNGRASYVPIQFGQTPRYYRENRADSIDIAFLKTAPMDKHGFFNFGGAVSLLKTVTEVADSVIIEENPNVPRVRGEQADVHISEVDGVVRDEEYDVISFPAPEASETDEKIANHVMEELNDGDVLQLGIGGLPNAIGMKIAESDLENLGIHSEMATDSMIDLFEEGKITNQTKDYYKGKTTFTFALGEKKLYNWIENNPTVHSLPVNLTNLPENIQKNDNQVAINRCLQVDLQGQCSSESFGQRHISGTGGQLEFVRGAYESEGGRSFQCLPSTTKDKETGEIKSNIVLEIEPGSVITVPRTDVMHIVTEWGMTKSLKGLTKWERANEIISVAHPDFREELYEKALENNIIPNRTPFLHKPP